MTLNDLPRFSGPKPVGAARVRRGTSPWRRGWNRRDFVRMASATGIGLGLASLGVFPPARRAYASHVGSDGYQIKPLPCPGYAANHNCRPGCGDSPVVLAACQTDPSAHTYGWHRNTGCRWKLRKNQCVSGTGWDGWRWNFSGSCESCSNSITFRCHDGWQCDSNCGNCSKSICRWRVGCS
jgi:hypothetical protein